VVINDVVNLVAADVGIIVRRTQFNAGNVVVYGGGDLVQEFVLSDRSSYRAD
jgi:hypothetical protein